MTKRIATLLLVVYLVLALVVGCTVKETPSPKETTKPETTDKAAGSTTGKKSNFNEVGYPIVDEKVTLHFATDKGESTVSLDDPKHIWQDIEKLTNIHIEWNNIPIDSWADRINLMFATGDLPDAFITCQGGGVSLDQQVEYGSKGVLLDLEDLIEEYCPNVKKMYKQNIETKLLSTSPDGNIYALPYVSEAGDSSLFNRHYINRVWLEKLGLEMPVTTDDFVNVLRAFRDRDPNENGLKDEIPLTFRFNHHNDGCFGFLTPFGCLDTGREGSTHVSVRNDVVIFEPITQNFKEAIRWFSSLYKEGLIDENVFAYADDWTQYDAKGQGDVMLYGVFSAWLGEDFGPYSVGGKGATIETDYITLPPLKGPDGTQAWLSRPPVIWPTAFVVTNVNKYVKETMRWVDLCYDPEWSFELNYGPVGYAIEKDDNGMYSYIETENKEDMPKRGLYAPGLPPSYISKDFLANRIIPRPTWEYGSQLDTYSPFISNNYLPSLAYTKEESEQISELVSEIHWYTRTKRASWIACESDIDVDWDEYIETLNQMGVQDLVKIYQNAYDRAIGK